MTGKERTKDRISVPQNNMRKLFSIHCFSKCPMEATQQSGHPKTPTHLALDSDPLSECLGEKKVNTWPLEWWGLKVKALCLNRQIPVGPVQVPDLHKPHKEQPRRRIKDEKLLQSRVSRAWTLPPCGLGRQCVEAAIWGMFLGVTVSTWIKIYYDHSKSVLATF